MRSGGTVDLGVDFWLCVELNPFNHLGRLIGTFQTCVNAYFAGKRVGVGLDP